MEKLKFKTNINCDACLSKVTPVLNANHSIASWEVDLKNPDKVLTLTGTGSLDEEELLHALKKVGYKAERIA